MSPLIASIRRCLAACAVVLFLAAAAEEASAESWNGFRGGADGNRIQQSIPGWSGLDPIWSLGSTYDASASRCVTVDNGIVFTIVTSLYSTRDRVIAVRARDGKVLWSTGTFTYIGGCPVPRGDLVYVTTMSGQNLGGAVKALDQASGNLVWDTELHPQGGFVFSSVSVDEDRVFVHYRGSYTWEPDAWMLGALDADTGALIWARPGMDTDLSGPVAGSGSVVSRIADETRVSPGYVAYDVEDGSELWSVSDSGNMTLLASERDGIIYHRSGGRTIVARDIVSGTTLWTRSLDEFEEIPECDISDVLVDVDRVYLRCEGFGGWPRNWVLAFDRRSGQSAWVTPIRPGEGIPASPLRKIGGRLLLGDSHSFDPATGEMGPGLAIGQVPSRYLDTENVAYADRTFYFWTSVISSFDPAATFYLNAVRESRAPQVVLDGPASGRYSVDDFHLSWTADDGDGVGIDHIELEIEGEDPVPLPADSRDFQLSNIGPGKTALRVSAIDVLGNIGRSQELELDIEPAPFPKAVMSRVRGPVSGQVALSGADSHDTVVDGGIARFEWDLDGDGVFETDQGKVDTVLARLERSGIYWISLRVTNEFGNSDVTRQSIDVRQLPRTSQPGVVIENGAEFTKDPEVELEIDWPMLTSDISVSNDGGFLTSVSHPLPADGKITWNLDSSGPESLPKTVYVRYYGSGNDTVTHYDAITLDETAPVIEFAAATRAVNSTRPDAGRSARRKLISPFRLRLAARDGTSGVSAYQAAHSPSRRGPVFEVDRKTNLRRTVDPGTKYRPRLIRVRDAAGNWSRFMRVRRG